MPTLYKTTSGIRLVGKFFGLGLGAVLITFILFKVGTVLKEIISPTPLPPPTITFGKLPEIIFHASIDGSKNSYTLNTLTGSLPTFPDRISVYKTEEEIPGLLTIERARARVKNIGFSGNGVALSPSIYQWTNSVSPFKRLVTNIINFNFNLTSAYATDETITRNNVLPSENEAVKKATEFLQSFSGIPTDIDMDKTKTTLFQIQNGELTQVQSISNTQIIRVDYYQKDIGGYRIFYPNPDFSTMNLLVAKGTREPVVEAHFFHTKIASDSAGTYPIITAQEAWSILKKNNAHIARYDGESKSIDIQKIELGYYSPDSKTTYLMPIIVFSGDDNFRAYIPAITSEWIEKSTN